MDETLIFEIVDHGSDAYDDAVALRDLVLRQPLGLQFSKAELLSERDSLHVVTYNSHGILVASLVLKPLSDSLIKMRQVAVHTDHQRQGIGGYMVTFAERIVADRGYTHMVLHARDASIPFYRRHGYVAVGEPFTEVGIVHSRLEKVL